MEADLEMNKIHKYISAPEPHTSLTEKTVLIDTIEEETDDTSADSSVSNINSQSVELLKFFTNRSSCLYSSIHSDPNVLH